MEARKEGERIKTRGEKRKVEKRQEDKRKTE